MEENLENILSYKNTMRNFNLNRKVMQDKVMNELHVYQNGGTFVVTQELIGFLNYLVQSDKMNVNILDKNNLPINIPDVNEFLELVSERYFSSLNFYYQEYEQLRSSTKIEIALDL